MEHGIVNDWNDMERIWQYVFSKEQLQTFSDGARYRQRLERHGAHLAIRLFQRTITNLLRWSTVSSTTGTTWSAFGNTSFPKNNYKPSPMEHGIVNDWNDMERIWQYVFSK